MKVMLEEFPFPVETELLSSDSNIAALDRIFVFTDIGSNL